MTKILLLFSGLLACAGPAFSQAVWAQAMQATSPNGRFSSRLAFDKAHNQAVLFGGVVMTGVNTQAFLSDTWLWDGAAKNWTKASPAVSPPGRRDFAMTFDEIGQNIVLFGGQNAAGTDLADTWVWDGSTWTRKNVATSPSARSGHALVYDPDIGKVLLFGGDGPNDVGETWFWNGADSTWTLQHPASHPSARYLQQMTYDAARHVVVCYGGRSNDASVSGTAHYQLTADTWVFDGANWTQKSPASHPPERLAPSVAWNALLQQTVLFGGVDAVTLTPLAETWTWDGSNWSQLPLPGPPGARDDSQATYDSSQQQMVFFGGENLASSFLNDTWTLTATPGLTSVSIVVPAGAQFQFNGQTYTGSQVINIAPGTYSLAAGSTIATGTGIQQVFSSWSDGGAQTHTATVGNSPLTITATFVTQYLLTTIASPAAGGSVSQTGNVGNGPWYNAGTLVAVFESAASGYVFTGYSGACSGTAACFFTINAPATVTANFIIPTYQLSINVPANIQYSVGGFPFTGPGSLALPAGTYNISLSSPQASGTGAQTVFSSWSDGGAQSHSVTVTHSAITLTGNFRTQYLLTTSSASTIQGAVTYNGGPYFDAGATVLVLGLANAGYEFEYWTGDCHGSQIVCLLTMNAPHQAVGHFSVPLVTVDALQGGVYPARVGEAIAYDAGRKEVVLFGGVDTSDARLFLDDTWIFNGTSWAVQNPPVHPSGRNDFAMAYHAGTQKVILAGGSLTVPVSDPNGVNNAADTWAWDGNLKTWTRLPDLPDPPNTALQNGRLGETLVEFGQDVVMFGGLHGLLARAGVVVDGNLLSDTWVWNGAAWSLRTPQHSPSARLNSAHAYDTLRNQALLIGGNTTTDGSNLQFFDTWLWNGNDWIQTAPATPLGGSPAAAAFDPSIQQTVAFTSNGVWTWDGGNWQQREYAPPMEVAAYDAGAQELVGVDNTGQMYIRVAPRISFAIAGPPLVSKNADAGLYTIVVNLKNQGDIPARLYGQVTATIAGAPVAMTDFEGLGIAAGQTQGLGFNFPTSIGSGFKIVTITGYYATAVNPVQAKYSLTLLANLP